MGLLSKEGQELHAKILREGSTGMDIDPFRRPIPNIEVWKIIVEAGSSKNREPFHEAVRNFMVSGLWGEYGKLWPATLWETANDLPGITREEALAIWHQFLSTERRLGRHQSLMHQLHWDVLAAFYCPLRERYSALRDLVTLDLMKESSSNMGEQDSKIKWPLMITKAGELEVKKTLWSYRLRSSLLGGIEAFFGGLWQTYPSIITFLAAMLGGGLLTKLFEWLYGFFIRV
jgi:hypothetical protein